MAEARVCKLDGRTWNLHEKVKIVKNENQILSLQFPQKPDFISVLSNALHQNVKEDKKSGAKSESKKSKSEKSVEAKKLKNDFDDFEDSEEVGAGKVEEVVYLYEYVDEGKLAKT